MPPGRTWPCMLVLSQWDMMYLALDSTYPQHVAAMASLTLKGVRVGTCSLGTDRLLPPWHRVSYCA